MTEGAVTPGLIVAVDGGGSKTDVVALGLDGALLGHSQGTRSSPHMVGLAASLELIDSLIQEVAHGEPVAQAALFLAGLDLPPELDACRQAVSAYPWAHAAPPLIDNDLFALLRAGTREPDAVAVVCGTGINAVGVRADGATARFPALGTRSGDWGGGQQLGEQALWHAARAWDGRGPDTTLREAVPAHFGLPGVLELIEALHFTRIPGHHLAGLAPVLFRAADAGDEVARGLVFRQAEEIVAFAAAALRRLGLQDADVPVILGGGIPRARPALLLDQVNTLLARAAPHARLEIVAAPPILGAALLALDAAGACPAALERCAAGVGDRSA